jgi:hemolysin III
MSVNEIELPNYRLSHELWNSISHGIGGLFGIVATILMFLKIYGVYPIAAVVYDADLIYASIACGIYGLSIISCMTISCIYHGLAKNNGKRVLRVLDHDFVFFLVGGTYTAFCLIPIREVFARGGVLPYSGWIVLAITRAAIALGITMNSINIKKYSILSMLIYIIAGWSIIMVSDALINTISIYGFIYLLVGGIAFTIGAILYGIGKSHSVRWHTVFHFFVLFGIVLQFVAIYVYAL